MTESLPVSTANAQNPTHETVKTCIDALMTQYSPEKRNWRILARALSERSGLTVNAGFLNAAYRGKRKASPKLLAVLGIHVQTAPAPVCPHCGQVHVVPWCTTQEGEPVKAQTQTQAPVKPKKVLTPEERHVRNAKAAMTRAQRMYGQMITAGYGLYIELSEDAADATRFNLEGTVKRQDKIVASERVNIETLSGYTYEQLAKQLKKVIDLYEDEQ